MPSTRPTVDPVLDILEEMGYDFDELDGDGYKRSIKEAIIKLTNKDAGDSRIGVLIEELKKVKKSRKVEPKEKKTTIKASKFLPGSGKFNADDIKNNEAEMGDDVGKKDKIITFLNGDVKDNLDDIRDDLNDIKSSIDDGNKSAEDQYEEMRQAIIAARKRKREKDLENKDKKGGGFKDKALEMVTKPAGNFFGKLIKFVTMTFLGVIVNRILSILKDPSQLLDPIKQFFNAISGLMNSVMKGLWTVTAAPINFIIDNVNSGIKSIIDGINSVSGLLKLPPITAPELPLIPGPPEIPMIPLSKTAQAKNEGAVGLSGGGVVPGDTPVTGSDEMGGTDGMDGAAGMDGMDGVDAISSKGMDGVDAISSKGMDGMDGMDGVDAISSKGMDGMDGASGLDGSVGSQGMGGTDGTSSSSSEPQGFSGGGIVPAPYSSSFALGTGHNVIDTAPANIMGFKKGGKVPGKGNTDTVPAMLTPGEFVMSKGAVDRIGTDKLMAMNKAGGGTNKPSLMKFAGGGIVPGIDPPNKKGGKVVVVGGGGGSQSPTRTASSGGGDSNPKFSSTDPNNITMPVIKSLYNIIS